MSETNDPSPIDKRLIGRHLKSGALSPKDLERHLKGLPDLAASAAPVEATLEQLQLALTEGLPQRSGEHDEEEEEEE